MVYVNRVNSPYLNVYPDLGNVTNAAVTYGTDVEEDLETGRGHLAAMHLKETLPGKFREIPFGTLRPVSARRGSWAFGSL